MVITGKYWSVVLMLCGASVAVAAAQQAATEAPAGFDTPTLVEKPGSRSVSNGIAEPAGDSFALDQQIYELTHDVDSGLGPVFNARACADCHQNPVSGGASQFTELRVGHTDASGISSIQRPCCMDQPVDAMIPGPLGLMQCGRSSGVPAPACG